MSFDDLPHCLQFHIGTTFVQKLWSSYADALISFAPHDSHSISIDKSLRNWLYLRTTFMRHPFLRRLHCKARFMFANVPTNSRRFNLDGNLIDVLIFQLFMFKCKAITMFPTTIVIPISSCVTPEQPIKVLGIP